MRTVRLAEGVTAGDQRHGFLVVHGHAAEGLADVLRCQQRIGVAVGAFGVHVDKAHLHGGKRLLQLAIARVALIVEELFLGAPVDEVGLPVVGASAGKAEGLEAH